MRNRRAVRWVSDQYRYALQELERRQLLSNATLFVDSHATGSNNGTSWTNAYTSLVTALASSLLTGTGNTVLVAQGTYKPTTGTSRTVSFTLKSGVAIDGGYAGVQGSNPNLRSPTQFPTILSGDIGTAGNNSDNTNHVILGGTANSTGILDGVTISGGNANSGTPTSGGGYYSTTGTPMINNCIFAGNTADTGGGAAYLDDSSGGTTFTNCTFSSNTSSENGGAVETADASTFTNDSFSSNVGSFGAGGALYIDPQASTKVTGCTFASNTASSNGGAIFENGTAPTITSCIFRSNTASQGGAIYDSGTASTIHSPLIVQCVFDANTASSNGGGAMYNTQTSPVVTNCTFAANAANALTGVGPAIYGNTGSTLTLTNSIVWGNTGGFRAQIDGTNSYVANVTYSDIQSSMDGTGNISIDPQFVDADGTDNIAGTADDKLAIQPTSPAVDVGNNSASGLSGITTDIGGNARVVDVPTWTDPSGSPAVIDMGAYEAQPANAVYLAGPYFVAAGNRLRINGVASFAQTTGYGVAWSLNGDSLFPNDPMFVSRQAGSGLEIDTLIFTSETSAGNFSVSTTVTFVPDVLYVDDSAPVGGEGASWSHPFQTLQQALAIAAPGCTIEVGQGTYYPTSGTDRTASFVLQSGVQIEGGFAGYGAANPDARNVSSYVTTLSGNIGSASSNTDNSYHVVTAPLADSTAVLDGFTITAGNANGSGDPVDWGGGMYLDTASPTISNCTFTGNLALQGCGMYNFNSSPTLSGCTFTANVDSSATGAAMYNYGSSPTITNCIFTANQASAAAAVGNYASSSPTLSGCTFTGNTAVSGGGAIIDGAKAGTVNISNCTFNDNSATSSTSTGGAIEQLGGTLSVDTTFFRGNVAKQGGAIWLSGGTSTILSCAFIGNSAKNQGGAIEIITPNTVVANCTFYENSAVTSGGAIYATGVPDVMSSVLWSDTASSGAEIGLSNGLSTNVTYSDVQGGFTGATNMNADPQFHALPTAGVDGVWGTSDDVAGNLRQNDSSPVVDTGNTSISVGSDDIAGQPRVMNASIDMGAYEAQNLEAGQPVFEYDGNLTSPEVVSPMFGDVDPATISASDLQLYNLDTNGATQSASWVSYDAANKLLIFGLPDNVTANYQATVSSSTMKDIYGAPLEGYAYTNLYLLPGDANRDRTVNALDFNALANNYGKAATFSQGDFNYSGTVDSNDFALLASRYGTTLAPPAGSAMIAQGLGGSSATSLTAQPSNLFGNQPIGSDAALLDNAI